MALDAHQQDQIDQLKMFWERGGKWLVVLITLIIVSFLGYYSYEQYQKKQIAAAGALYIQFFEVMKNENVDKAKSLVEQLEQNYASTPYAPRAAMAYAAIAFDKKDLKTAKEQLTFAITNSNGEKWITSMARLNMAGVLADEKKYEEALQELDKPYEPVFSVQYNDLKGDILQTKGDVSAARQAYQAALDKISKKEDQKYQLIATKLAALGA